MSAFDTLEQQLRDSTGRRYRGSAGRVAPGGRAAPDARGGAAERFAQGRSAARPARRRAATRVVPLVAAAAVGAFLLARSPAPPDEREAAVPTPAATWTPVLGDDDRGHPSISRSAVPVEQAAAYAVLRRPQSAADRSRAVQALLARLSNSTVRGVRVDAIRRLDERAGRTVVLLSAEVLRMNPRDPADDIRDGLCLIIGYEGGSSGMTCGSFHDALIGRMRYTLPPRGLAPDGAATVRIRVRGGRTISIAPRDNYYDASWVNEGTAAGIARPRFYVADGRAIR